MPLAPGGSKETISRNISELYSVNADREKPRPQKQIVAIAYANARRTGSDRYRKRPKDET